MGDVNYSHIVRIDEKAKRDIELGLEKEIKITHL